MSALRLEGEKELQRMLRRTPTEVLERAIMLSRLKKGQRAVPVGRIEAWADHLSLRGDERAEFIDSAMWTAVPKRLRPWFETKLSGAKPTPRRR
jgi:hypothetical protein